MGFFSWKTADTDKSIANAYSGRDVFTVYVLQPNGLPPLTEDYYEGYGVFEGRDIYALVAQWNYPEKCKDEQGNWLPDDVIRNFGIDIACMDEHNAALKYPIKIVENPRIQYDDIGPSDSCPDQGFFYEDDVFYEKEEEEEIEDDIDDDIDDEDGVENINLFSGMEL